MADEKEPITAANLIAAEDGTDEEELDLTGGLRKLQPRIQKLAVKVRQAALAAEKSANPAAGALRLIADEVLPLLVDTVVESGMSFEMIEEIFEEGEGEEGEEGEEDGEVEGEGIDAEALEVLQKERESLYRFTRIVRAFLEQVVVSGVLKGKPAAATAADNLIGMAKGVELQGVADGFVTDEADQAQIAKFVSAFKA
jgi:hypothetical protein